MADWIFRPGGRLVRFRNHHSSHPCSKKRHGRPALGYGACYTVNVARRIRRAMNHALQRALRERCDDKYLDVTLLDGHFGKYQ